MCYVNITITAKFFEEICSSLFPSMISPGLIGVLQAWRWYVVTKLYAYISWPDFSIERMTSLLAKASRISLDTLFDL